MERDLTLVVITALTITPITVVALVAIVYGQKDIAALALKLLKPPLEKDTTKEQERIDK